MIADHVTMVKGQSVTIGTLLTLDRGVTRVTPVAGATARFLDAEQCWVTGRVLGVDRGLGCIRPRGGA